MIDPKYHRKTAISSELIEKFKYWNEEIVSSSPNLSIDPRLLEIQIDLNTSSLWSSPKSKFALDSKYFWAKQELDRVRNKIVHNRAQVRTLHPAVLDPRLHAYFEFENNEVDVRHEYSLFEIAADYDLTVDQLLDLIIYDLSYFMFFSSEATCLTKYYRELEQYQGLLRSWIKFCVINQVYLDKRKHITSNSPDHAYPNNDEEHAINVFASMNLSKRSKTVNSVTNEKLNRRIRKIDRTKQRSYFSRNISTINKTSTAVKNCQNQKK